MLRYEETICSPVHKPGTAISIIRLSGSDAISIVGRVFTPKDRRSIDGLQGYTLLLGDITDGDRYIDQVMVSLFKSPRSYTGEDMAEISCHGSWYIQSKIMELLIREGAMAARPGEFTRRAFINGKMDLVQAEAVADLIAAEAEAAHRIAVNQLRGGYSEKFGELRKDLLELTTLLELELDFAEEDLEFADRRKLLELTERVKSYSDSLAVTFSAGNAIRKGVPVAIAGRPNVGKSTLLNGILNEERAIVSEIPGTTRDSIEDTYVIDGILYRFIDTAGIRATDDRIESIGVRKAIEKISGAALVIFVTEGFLGPDVIKGEVGDFINDMLGREAHLLVVVNKSDLATDGHAGKIAGSLSLLGDFPVVFMSARESSDYDSLRSALGTLSEKLMQSGEDTIVTNVRHYEALIKVSEAAGRAGDALKGGLSSDLVAVEVRHAIHYLGEITGQVTTDEVLANIFSNFCIGK